MDKKQLSMMEKQIRITELYPALMKHPNLMKFFDLKSDKLLYKKIEVLESLEAGKNIEEISGFYDIFELMPQEGIWD